MKKIFIYWFLILTRMFYAKHTSISLLMFSCHFVIDRSHQYCDVPSTDTIAMVLHFGFKATPK